jgi:alpha-amylase/alpha-mannosidase (GH57 family)
MDRQIENASFLGMPGGEQSIFKGQRMKRYISLAIAVIVTLIMSACAGATETPEPTTPVVPTPEPTTQPVERGPLTIEDGKLYIAIIWHQHQPVYLKDPETGIYEKPWVRLHAAKDYVDMASTLLDYPLIHATFNLTPSLIRQLDDISAGAKDLYWTHTEIRAEDLTQEQKQFILDHFFDINPSIIARFPRYQELSQMRGADAVDTWSIQDFRDLQVLFNLAWTDPAFLEEEPLASVVAKGRDFDGGDKTNVLAAHLRLVEEVIQLHADMQDDGQIEVTMTPYAHPILPLLVDSDLASIALPDADLPTRFVYGQDAVAQVKLGVEFYQDHFGQPPRGMWPAEGSVAEQALSMISAEGIQWIATDEDVLAGSLPDVADFTRDSNDVVQQADALYRPYEVQGARGDPFAIIFRDHLISDKVGFEYSGMPGEAAAADFIARLEAIKDRLEEEGGEGPHLATILLDGENAWEYYENDGKEFLNEMYRLLSESEDLVTVTPSEYLDALDEADVELRQIETLWAGSWIDGTFSTWIGEEEENAAWEYLRQAREAVQDASSTLDEETLDQAMDLIYIAEGSDWFWWYGADQNSGSDDSFDRQFRGYLEQIYNTLGTDVPDYVYVPIIPQAAQSPDREATGLLSVTADGVAGEREWDDGAFYDVSDAVSEAAISGIYYGFDEENLFLRVDAPGGFTDNQVIGFYMGGPGSGATNASSRYGAGETLLGFGVKRLVEVTFEDGLPQARIYTADGAGGWKPLESSLRDLEQIALGDGMLEIVAPFAQFLPEARSGDRINVRLVVSEDGSDVAVIPDSGPALATVPDLPITNVFLDLSDPSNDDNGPGTYQYPSDAVFKTGVFDITGLTVGFDEEDYIFRIQFRGPVLNDWDSPNGLSVQTIDVYVDYDGPGSGARMLLPGRNAALTPEFAWDVAIWAEGWTPGIFAPSDEGPVETAAQLSIITNPGQRRVTLRVPKSALPGDPTGWNLALVVMSQEGYPSSGVWRVRDVLPVAEQWRIGGGSGSPADTRIIDLLWPEGNQPSQAELLGHENPVDVDLASLGPDDYPQVPMVGP